MKNWINTWFKCPRPNKINKSRYRQSIYRVSPEYLVRIARYQENNFHKSWDHRKIPLGDTRFDIEGYFQGHLKVNVVLRNLHFAQDSKRGGNFTVLSMGQSDPLRSAEGYMSLTNISGWYFVKTANSRP